MSNEMFTQLPTVTSAQMTDIICAVQGYSSPTVLGTSVQETLAQVYDLFQTNIILSNAGNPNGSVAGSTYQLCWDTTDGILYVCTTTGSASTAVWSKSITLTAGSGITISQSGNTINISSAATGLTWNSVGSTTVSMVTNNGYYVAEASATVLTLPTTASFGDTLIVIGTGAGGWTIAQNALQNIRVGSAITTTGTGGSLASTNRYDALELTCVVANTSWQTAFAPQSNALTII